MKAVVWHGVGDIRLDEVPEPKLEQPDDAIVRLTVSAICGTDLHMVRGTMAGMVPGTILGHEGVGVVEEVGTQVRNLRPGDRVVIPSTICCGTCSYCRAGYTAQCDVANPHGRTAGTAFFGGPENTGPFQGLQARYARVPYAPANLVPLPDMVTDEQAIMLSDIFPTGWFGAELAEITQGDTVAVFGCGPVGQFAIASARHLRAGRVIAVDGVADRLELARDQHAEVVDYHAEDPVEVIRDLTRGSGVDRVIDAVGVDAESPEGPRSEEVESVAEQGVAQEWGPGGAPSQAARWSVEAVAKAGTVGIVGVYPPQLTAYPIGAAMNKNLTVNMGNCNHRTYLPELLDLTLTGVIDPLAVLTRYEPASDAIEAYRVFGQRTEGWMKVALDPTA
jgi:threonine dehydrogenase-like Zn-dependent dehydrogenase